ncbi:hypothetical protein DMENIID0001_022680 [Sergentomyia squamirostris]
MNPENDRNVNPDDLSSDSEDKLTICTNLPMKKRRIKRKRRADDTEEANAVTAEDYDGDNTKNLSPGEIRMILKKVVSNDHVLAMVRLKEEQMGSVEPEEEIEVEKEITDLMPKLTRLKAKELNRQLPSIIPLTLKPPEEESETVILMTKDLTEEDDDDEEYKPSEEYFHSDDETNTSISDMDSQPATPGTDSIPPPDPDDPVKYTKDGLFKIPQVCPTPSPSKNPQESFRPPALGTRSKISLAKTTIEDIEETFIPPDITTDMYEFDCDMDHVWKEFLHGFRRPLATPETHEEDDEADPEYVAADQIPLDCEEFREGKVSRKELSDLMAELFDGIDDDVATEFIPPAAEQEPGGARTKPTPTKYQKIRTDVSPERSLNPPGLIHSTPVAPHMMYHELQPKGEYFLEESTILEDSLDMAVDTRTDSTHQYDSHSESSTEVINFNTADSPKEIFYKIMEMKYRQMARIQPAEVFEPHQIGFTDFQRQILAQQLRMHVQLNAQHFIQTYSHPELWREAETPRKMLQELWEVARVNRNSTFNAINLQGAVELCDSWRREMDIINDDNTDFMQDLKEQKTIEESRKNNRKWNTKSLHPRVINVMMNSNVFLYPKLLPNIPFRVAPFQHQFHRNESAVIAHFYDAVHRELRDQASRQRKYAEPSRRRICEKIHRFICPWRTPRQLYKFIYRENRSLVMNPIKFYLENHRLLPVSHVIDSITPNRVLADLPLSCLPKNWESHFQAEKKRKQKAQRDKELVAKRRKRQEVLQRHQSLRKNLSKVNTTLKNTSSEVDVEIPSTSSGQDVTIFRTDSFVVSVQKDAVLKVGATGKESIPTQTLDRSLILKIKLENVLKDYIQELENYLKAFKNYPILSKIFSFFWEFDIFLTILRKGMQTEKRTREDVESSSLNPLQEDRVDVKKLKVLEDNKPDLEPKEIKKHKHRLHDSNRLLLLPERTEDLMQRDSVYAWNFFEKVECTLKAEKQFDKFEKFLTLMTSFKPGKDEVPDLYYKLEELFFPDHPELCELFLTILLPSHAAQVGKFFEHFILTNMQTFWAKINTYFAKQPYQLKKIYACLSELQREEGLTMDKIKAKFLPLLKGNQLLTDWFLQLFPNERPPVSDTDEFEVINLRKHTIAEEEGNPTEMAEEIQAERLKDPYENPPCSIKYMQGRIYYGNRVLLPAELSFLASSHEVDTLRTDKESQSKTCVHDIKNAWDLKIQEGLRLIQSDPVDPGPSDATTTTGEQSQKSNNTSDSPAKLCDYPTLKMHAYRLNPHAITTEMVLACQEGVDEGHTSKQSPKKTSTGKKNPTSPKRTVAKGGIKIQENSSAIEMAKRLKMFLTTDDKPPKPKRVRQKKIPEGGLEGEHDGKGGNVQEKVNDSF